ncbi:Uncharacterised protein [Vibrio cholerae]|nr:Uncharacterised protein [Vibrio cholerae]
MAVLHPGNEASLQSYRINHTHHTRKRIRRRHSSLKVTISFKEI